MKKNLKRKIYVTIVAMILAASACAMPENALAKNTLMNQWYPVSADKFTLEEHYVTNEANTFGNQQYTQGFSDETRMPVWNFDTNLSGTQTRTYGFSEKNRMPLWNKDIGIAETTAKETRRTEYRIQDKETEQSRFTAPYPAEPKDDSIDPFSPQSISVTKRDKTKTTLAEKAFIFPQFTGDAKENVVRFVTEPDTAVDLTSKASEAQSSPAAVNTESNELPEDWEPSVEDGQPESSVYDDSTCLVVLGYQLNPDGSMQPELIGRLQTLLTAAKQYPNSLIVCTGGPTASNNPNVSEGGQMAKWLINNGVDPRRILVEDQSMTTQGNAANTLSMLARSSPQVKNIVVITSNYHMSNGVTSFQSQASRMGSGITVLAGNAYQAR